MYEIFADLHVHIGRAQNNKPIKITAAKSLNFENIAKECLNRKGIQIVGIIDLRHTLNDFLKDFGNCGYSVRPSERRKGYATEMLRQILDVARESGMTELHLSVERDNEPSIKTIISNGGVYERSFEFENEMADIYGIGL